MMEILVVTNLGYEYHVLGTVEHGNKVGRKLGFPTANINYEDVYYLKRAYI